MTINKDIGNKGELIAANFLQEKGYVLQDRNYQTRYGELDLVMLDSDMVVFIEVKTRTSDLFGLPEESITPTKLARIQKTGLLWLQAHPDSPEDWRIDAVSIVMDHEGKIHDIKHFINALL